MFNPIEHQIALGRIEEFISSRGYSVKYDSTSYFVNHEECTIHAPKQYKHTSKLICALLHEAGHIITPDSLLLHARATTKRNQAVVIEQEYLAWSAGFRIAEELNIYTEAFSRVYTQEWISHWGSYVNLGLDPAFNSLVEPYIEQWKGNQSNNLGFSANRSRGRQCEPRENINQIKGIKPIDLG